MSRDRAQTTQDFAVGISVFLLTLSLTFAYVPSLFTPFDGRAETSASAQADRAASDVLSHTSLTGYSTRLNATATNEFLRDNAAGDDLRATLALPSRVRANVTLEHVDGGTVDDACSVYADITANCAVAAGDTYRDEPAGVMSRIVSLDGDRYRLVVRVWE